MYNIYSVLLFINNIKAATVEKTTEQKTIKFPESDNTEIIIGPLCRLALACVRLYVLTVQRICAGVFVFECVFLCVCARITFAIRRVAAVVHCI